MTYEEILRRCVGQTVMVNNQEERVLAGVEEDFIVLQGGNPQLKITEFVPFLQIVKVIRLDYSTGSSSISLDLNQTGRDQGRSSGPF